jgi:alanine racemase
MRSTKQGAAGAAITAVRGTLVEAGEGGALGPLPRSAWLEIDLDALVANVRLIEGILPPGVRLEPVVKADAYGHGAVMVARALVAAGIRSLSVATYDEALELRRAGVDVPILVVFPIPPELAPDARRNRMSVSAGDRTLLERTLAALDAAARDTTGAGNPAATTDEPLAMHVEVETGLGRGGVAPAEVAATAAMIEASPHARLAGLWSHLQAADNAEISAEQARRFGAAGRLLGAAGMAVPMRHLAASGGVLTRGTGDCEVVRVGLAQYGLVPDGLEVPDELREVAARLRPVMSLRAKPVRVAWLEAGSGVSYGPTFRTTRRSLIATLPVGYADGYFRAFSNRASVLVRGLRAPQVGTVAMDAVMVDVTDVPGAPVTVDDVFTLLGAQGSERIGAEEMARWGDTISYEVLAGWSGRLPRVYYAAASTFGVRTLAWEPVGSRGRLDREPDREPEG